MDTYDEIYGRMKNVYEQETGDSFNEKAILQSGSRCLRARFSRCRQTLNGGKDRCLQ